MDYRKQAFRNKAERGVKKAMDAINSIGLAAQQYRGRFDDEDAKAVLAALRGAVDGLEAELFPQPRTMMTFRWPTP